VLLTNRVTGRVRGKIAQSVAQPNYSQNYCTTFPVEKSGPKIGAPFVVHKKLPKENNRPIGENWGNLVTVLTKTHGSCRDAML
jgi:hypothetical protein